MLPTIYCRIIKASVEVTPSTPSTSAASSCVPVSVRMPTICCKTINASVESIPFKPSTSPSVYGGFVPYWNDATLSRGLSVVLM